MEGWIKIHRKLKDHWLWQSERRLKWWIDILLTVNHCDSKVLIKGNLIECKRGQSVRSLDTWAKDWNVTKKTVKEFFELLQKDSMLLYEGIKITTRITVCNYDDYQEIVNTKETKGKRKVNGEETDTTHKQECKEGIKNDKEEEKIQRTQIFKESILVFKDKYSIDLLKEFFNYWSESGKNGKMRFELEKVFEVSKRLATWKRNDEKFNGNKIDKKPQSITVSNGQNYK